MVLKLALLALPYVLSPAHAQQTETLDDWVGRMGSAPPVVPAPSEPTPAAGAATTPASGKAANKPVTPAPVAQAPAAPTRAGRKVDEAPAATEAPVAVAVPTDFYDDPAAALAGDPLHLDEIDLSEFDVPIELNDLVKTKLKYFLGAHRKSFEIYLQRMGRYQPLIEAEIAKAGLPKDLIYLSMMESGFNPNAYSSAHAAGLWQFIPTTGQYYGLKVDWWLDERRDPHKATPAALRMLGELHDMFGDWYLAYAAYNAGPGRIRNALTQVRVPEGRKATYWDLVAQDLIHSETKGYVPKILAASIIGHHPERYGFGDVVREAPLDVEKVSIEGAVDVGLLADLAGLDEGAFRAVNPALLRYATPEGKTDVYVPRGSARSVLAKLDAVPAAERLRIVKVKVASEDTLSSIASRYGLQAQDLVYANALSSASAISPGQTLVVPVRPGQNVDPALLVAVATTAPKPTTATTAPPAATPSKPADGTYVVQRGDTLALIAEKTHTSLTELQTWNGVRNPDLIEVGTVLRLSAKPGTTPTPSTAVAPAPTANKPTTPTTVTAAPAPKPTPPAPTTTAPKLVQQTYKVQPGDTISVIATMYDVEWSDVSRWNKVYSSKDLKPGQSLTLWVPSGFKARPHPGPPKPPPKPTSYTVRSGDTLSEIAERFDVALNDLASWNGLKGDVLPAGKVLVLAAPKAAPSSSSSTSSTTYKVKSGDSLGAIADKFDTTVANLQALNHLKSTTIQPGQTLVVKGAASKSSSSTGASSSSSSSSSSSWKSYTVRSGDSLSVIAAKYGVSVADLQSWNGLKGTSIQVGQTLKIKAK
jgi:membrane-bound lytic murein transglycosylase D